MPCAWSYGEIATRLQAGATDHPVYRTWLGFFASDEYAALVERMKGELEALARRGADQAHMKETFKTGARLELGFWEMAHGLEQWPDVLCRAAA
jgi:thiaminase/transcriptional activator TenA